MKNRFRKLRIVNDAYPDRANETVLVQASEKSGTTARDPGFRATVDDVVKRVSAQPGVIHIKSPYGAGNTGHDNTATGYQALSGNTTSGTGPHGIGLSGTIASKVTLP